MELDAQKNRNEQLTRDKLELTALLERRVAEFQAMDEQVSALRTRLISATQSDMDSSLRSEGLELREISLVQKEARLEQEAQLRTQQISNLEAEVDRLMKELVAVRSERTHRISELEAALERKTDDNKRLQEKALYLSRAVEKKDHHEAQLVSRLKQLQEGRHQLEHRYRGQIAAQDEIIEIKDKSYQDEKKRNDALVQGIREMQDLLKTAKEANAELEATLQEKCDAYEDVIRSRDSTIRKLEKQLTEAHVQLNKNSKEHLDRDLEVYFPAASSAHRMLREDRPMPSPAEVSSLMEELEAEKNQNEMLRNQIQKMVTEAEEKAPLIHGKIFEHKNAVEMLTAMQIEVSKLCAEKESYDQERQTLIQLNKQNQRELKRYAQENEDLSRQVRHLLMSVHEARGHRLSSQVDQITSSGESSPANLVISTHMVTFKSVEELQAQNRKLLSALRELSESQEEMEKDTNDSEVQNELRHELKQVLEEVENLRRERKVQAEKLDALVKQRDALTAMTAAFAPLESFNSIQKVSTSAQHASNEQEIIFFRERLEKVQSDYDTYRNETETRLKDATSQVLKANEDLHKIKIEETSLLMKLETAQRSLENAKEMIEEFKTELDSVKEKNIKLSKDQKKVVTDLRKTKDELDSKKNDLRKLETTIKTISGERDHLRVREQQLVSQVELLQREMKSKESLGETAKTLQTFLTKMDVEDSRVKMSSALISKLDQENAYLKATIEKQSKDTSTKQERVSKLTEELRMQLTVEKDKNTSLMREIKILEDKVDQIQKEMAATKSTPGPRSALTPKMTELQNKFLAKNREADHLKQENQKLTTELAQVKKIIVTQEEKFKKTINLSRDEKDRLTESNAKNNQLQEELKSLNQSLEESRKEIESLKKDASAHDEKLKKLAHQARSRIQSLQTIKAQMEQEISELKQQIQTKSDDGAASQQMKEENVRLKAVNSQNEVELIKLRKELAAAASAKNDGDTSVPTSVPVPPVTQPTPAVPVVAPPKVLKVKPTSKVQVQVKIAPEAPVPVVVPVARIAPNAMPEAENVSSSSTAPEVSMEVIPAAEVLADPIPEPVVVEQQPPIQAAAENAENEDDGRRSEAENHPQHPDSAPPAAPKRQRESTTEDSGESSTGTSSKKLRGTEVEAVVEDSEPVASSSSQVMDQSSQESRQLIVQESSEPNDDSREPNPVVEVSGPSSNRRKRIVAPQEAEEVITADRVDHDDEVIVIDEDDDEGQEDVELEDDDDDEEEDDDEAEVEDDVEQDDEEEYDEEDDDGASHDEQDSDENEERDDVIVAEDDGDGSRGEPTTRHSDTPENN